MSRKYEVSKRAMIGRNLAVARELAGYTQSKVMLHIFGSSDPKQKNRISEIESGTLLPDAEMLHNLCNFYGVSSDFVLGFTCEPVLDKSIQRAAFLYNGIAESIGTTFQAMAMQLTLIGAKYVNALPHASILEIIDNAKKLSREIQELKLDAGHPLNIKNYSMIELIREAEKQIAIQHRDFEMGLDEISNRDEIDKRQQMLADHVEESMKSFRKVSLPNKKEINQLDLLSEKDGE